MQALDSSINCSITATLCVVGLEVSLQAADAPYARELFATEAPI